MKSNLGSTFLCALLIIVNKIALIMNELKGYKYRLLINVDNHKMLIYCIGNELFKTKSINFRFIDKDLNQ